MKARGVVVASATLVAGGLICSGVASAVESSTARVVVSATRVEESSFDLPVSVDSVDAAQIQQQQLQVNLSESLVRVPGVVVQNRQNYAQDLQVSTRGFGARSTFGVRGIRLYSDGIPATMPDGQGQLSHFDLGSAGSVEVLRGPFSALYGNSSGGVISLFTEDGKPGATLEGDAAFGSDATRRIGLKASGDTGSLNYLLSGSEFHTDGYRDHSSVTRDIYNAKLRVTPDDATKVTLVINSLAMPEAQDPLGLTHAQFDAGPRQAGTGALEFNTRKRVAQTQGGLIYERMLTSVDTLTSTLYHGRRESRQFQSIPVGAQIPASSPGGLIDLVRDYGGVDMRWTRRTTLAGEPLRFSAGLNYETVEEQRRGYQNFLGPSASPTAYGIFGTLRRDESNDVSTFDQYLQAEWQPGRQWLLLAGVRHGSVKVSSHDKYLVNGDDSGAADYSATNPVLGVTYKATEGINLYASFGRGFETPTVNEISYRSSGSGLNFGLQPAKSDHLEAGVKAFLGPDTLLTAAAFHIKTRDEIAVLSNSGGRSVFQNVGGTKRDGLEVAFDTRLPQGFALYGAYTWLRAEYTDTFLTCTGSPCTTPNVPVAAGNSLPGIPRSTLYADLTWKDVSSGFFGGLEVRRVAQVKVNDINSDAAPAYTVGNLRLGFEQRFGGWRAKEFYRVDNIGDRKYAGSVIVNEGKERYFESAPGRTHLLGVSLTYAW